MKYNEDEIQQVMTSHNCSRQHALTVLAIEYGESDGDVITDEDDLESDESLIE